MSATYDVSEVFYSIQGEGKHAGRPAVFLRLQYCNLWKDGSKPSKVCPFCDTSQLHTGKTVSFDALCGQLLSESSPHTLLTNNLGLVITGGEPLLQLDSELMQWAEAHFAWIDVETNGTVPPKEGLHFGSKVCVSVSPKSPACFEVFNTVEHAGQYKILIPAMERLLRYVEGSSRPVYLQPVEVGGYDSEQTKANIARCVELIRVNPKYILCLQLHKVAGVR